MDSKVLDHLIAELKPTAVLKVGRFGLMLLFVREETVAVFQPSTMMRWGTRLLHGNFGFFIGASNQELTHRSRIAAPDSLTLSPMANYPQIIGESAIENDRVSDRMIQQIADVLKKIPDTVAAIHAALGTDFLEKSSLERLPILTRYLRSTAE